MLCSLVWIRKVNVDVMCFYVSQVEILRDIPKSV